MTDPIDVLIYDALMPYITTPALTSPVTDVSYPLIPYTPTSDRPYFDVRNILRAQPQYSALGFAGSVLNRGIFQIDAVVPDGAGEVPGLRLAAAVAARFPIGLSIAAGPYKLQFQKLPTIAAAVQDAPWIRFPVSVPYLLIS